MFAAQIIVLTKRERQSQRIHRSGFTDAPGRARFIDVRLRRKKAKKQQQR